MIRPFFSHFCFRVPCQGHNRRRGWNRGSIQSSKPQDKKLGSSLPEQLHIDLSNLCQSYCIRNISAELTLETRSSAEFHQTSAPPSTPLRNSPISPKKGEGDERDVGGRSRQISPSPSVGDRQTSIFLPWNGDGCGWNCKRKSGR